MNSFFISSLNKYLRNVFLFSLKCIASSPELYVYVLVYVVCMHVLKLTKAFLPLLSTLPILGKYLKNINKLFYVRAARLITVTQLKPNIYELHLKLFSAFCFCSSQAKTDRKVGKPPH